MEILPGSEIMVGGPHLCMVKNIKLSFENWRCDHVYIHVAHQRTVTPPTFDECDVVLRGIDAMSEYEYAILFNNNMGKYMPGVYTVISHGYRVDFRIYNKDYLWAEVYIV